MAPRLNVGYAGCLAGSCLSAVFLIAAIFYPVLCKLDTTLTVNNTLDVPITSSAGHVNLGMFRFCRTGYGAPISDECDTYSKSTSVVYQNLCEQRDGDGHELLFCEKRNFVEAFTLTALACCFVSIGVCATILSQHWLTGPCLFIPASAQAFSANWVPMLCVSGVCSLPPRPSRASLRAVLSMLIALGVFGSYLGQQRSNAAAGEAQDVGGAYVFLIVTMAVSAVASGLGYKGVIDTA